MSSSRTSWLETLETSQSQSSRPSRHYSHSWPRPQIPRMILQSSGLRRCLGNSHGSRRWKYSCQEVPGTGPNLLSARRLVEQAGVLTGQVLWPGGPPERGQVQAALLVDNISDLQVSLSVNSQRPGVLYLTHLACDAWSSRCDIG